MNHTEIFKKALKITMKNRFLWLFGVLVALIGGFDSFDYSRIDLRSRLMVAIPAIIIVSLILIILSTIARAGLIRSLGKIEENKNPSFGTQLKDGRRFFWKLIGLEAILILSFLVVMAILFLPVIFLFASKNNAGGIFVSLFASLIFLVLIVIWTFLRIFGRLYAVLGNIGIMSSLEKAYSLFINNIKKSLKMLLLFIPIGILIYIATVILWNLVSSLFILLDQIASDFLGKSTDISGSIGTILVFIPATIFLKAVYEVFSQSAWVLFFYEIASPKDDKGLPEKEKEEDAVSAPDTAISGNCS